MHDEVGSETFVVAMLYNGEHGLKETIPVFNPTTGLKTGDVMIEFKFEKEELPKKAPEPVNAPEPVKASEPVKAPESV